jgi:type I restriction enzyme S subunit
VDETENYLSEKGAQSQHKRFLPPDSVVVSCIATPGLVTLTSQKSQTNQQINSVIPNDGALREYLYLTFDHQSHRIKRLASGGTATAILNKTDFSNVELLSPPSDVIEAFHDKCSVWFDLMKNNLAENQTLAEIRDYLLPKLVSGEIEVDAAEEVAGDTMEEIA